MIQWYSKKFDELTVSEFHDLIALRIAIFVVEQKCAFQELDGVDQNSIHVLAKNEKQEIVACSRLIPPGKLYKEASIGRVSTRIDYRRTGLGRPLMEYSLKQMEQLFPKTPIKIMAQKYLEKFYSDFGFVTISDDFIEDDIVHVYMLRSSQRLK